MNVGVIVLALLLVSTLATDGLDRRLTYSDGRIRMVLDYRENVYRETDRIAVRVQAAKLTLIHGTTTRTYSLSDLKLAVNATDFGFATDAHAFDCGSLKPLRRFGRYAVVEAQFGSPKGCGTKTRFIDIESGRIPNTARLYVPIYTPSGQPFDDETRSATRVRMLLAYADEIVIPRSGGIAATFTILRLVGRGGAERLYVFEGLKSTAIRHDTFVDVDGTSQPTLRFDRKTETRLVAALVANADRFERQHQQLRWAQLASGAAYLGNFTEAIADSENAIAFQDDATLRETERANLARCRDLVRDIVAKRSPSAFVRYHWDDGCKSDSPSE